MTTTEFVRDLLVPYSCGFFGGLAIGFMWGQRQAMKWCREMTRRAINDAFKKMAGGQHGE